MGRAMVEREHSAGQEALKITVGKLAGVVTRCINLVLLLHPLIGLIGCAWRQRHLAIPS